MSNVIEIDKDNSDHAGMYWVTSIKKDKSEVRDHIKYVLIKDDTITSTDGNRLHNAKLNDSYQPGLYMVSKRTKGMMVIVKMSDEVDQFPDFDDMLKPAKGTSEVFASIDTIYKGFAEVIRALDKDNTLNFEYFRDVLVNCNDGFDIHVSKESKPIVMESNNGKVAILMPMRM